MDIDHFKTINDTYGHDVGDLVLKEVARTLRVNSRSGDILCRLGGEEFLSINVACSSDEAVACAERLRVAIEDMDIDYPGFRHTITISLGVSQRVPITRTVDDLIKVADEALYGAKDAGRNCVVHEGVVRAPERRLSA
jgi:diguanylate cyclase (GGDEF)-like protein